MAYSAIKTWWLMYRLWKDEPRRVRFAFATKAVRSGYRYTPGHWIGHPRDASVSACPEESP